MQAGGCEFDDAVCRVIRRLGPAGRGRCMLRCIHRRDEAFLVLDPSATYQKPAFCGGLKLGGEESLQFSRSKRRASLKPRA